MKKLNMLALLLICSSSTFAKDVTVTLEVPSMNCAICPITVTKALEVVNGVQNVEVTFKDRLAVVIFDDEKINTGSLTKATKDAGYPSLIKQ